MSPDRSIPSLGTKTSRPIEHKIMRTGNKNFASGSLRGMIGLPLLFSPLDSWIFESRLWEKRHHILDADSEHV